MPPPAGKSDAGGDGSEGGDCGCTRQDSGVPRRCDGTRFCFGLNRDHSFLHQTLFGSVFSSPTAAALFEKPREVEDHLTQKARCALVHRIPRPSAPDRKRSLPRRCHRRGRPFIVLLHRRHPRLPFAWSRNRGRVCSITCLCLFRAKMLASIPVAMPVSLDRSDRQLHRRR